MIVYTVKEIAERLKIDREKARELVNALVALDLASCRGERRVPKGGRAEPVYAIRRAFALTLDQRFADAGLVGTDFPPRN